MYYVMEKGTNTTLAVTKFVFIVKAILQKYPNQCIVRYTKETRV